MNTGKVAKQAKNLQQPDDHNNHYYDIEYFLDFAIHRDHVIDKPQNKTCDNDYEQNGKERHSCDFNCKTLMQRYSPLIPQELYNFI